ncbi:MAG: hypothetical protein H7X84_11285 [Verrucomicrobia bacterium]|nr:hypothetical protein [Prolixibacteraceae bacterium]
MSKTRILIIIAILVVVLLGIYGINKMIRHFQMEACIKKGGQWNHELNRCEDAEPDSSALHTEYYWHTVYDSIQNKEYLNKGKLLDSKASSVPYLIEVLNKRPPECKIEYVDRMNDTLQIRILNDEFLTEQMGSSGSYCFLGETVYTLTEKDSIKFVRIDMKEGSHASPGTYQRSNFKDLVDEEDLVP